MIKKKFPTRIVAMVSLLSILFLGVLVVGANFSIIDRIADKAGEVLGRSLADQITIDQPEEMEDLSVGGVISEDWVKVGNRVTYTKSARFADKTAMLFSIPNPFGGGTATSTNDEDYNDDTHRLATSTAKSLNIDITGASTSTVQIICGGAADATSDPTYELFNLTAPTSTIGVFNNNQATTTDGLGVIGTGSATQILLTHEYSHFNCIATSTSDDWATYGEAITGGANTFDGTWSLEIQKNLQ